ncbi:MAG: O-antigen ligase family protein [Spirochaetes bacterium]|nr:O-antigen ligase family protein [Spirochaetota bacterium]
MAKKHHAPVGAALHTSSCFLPRLLAWGTGLLGLLMVLAFFTGTYDKAQIKDTLLFAGGGTLLLTWLAYKIQQGRARFSRASGVWVLPFAAYYGWVLASVLWAPYRVEALAEWARYAVYFGLSLMALEQFGTRAARIIARCVGWSAWAAYGYGLLQVLNRFVPGADFMPWQGFFGPRVFSTLANPNFFGDFIVFSSFLIAAQYLVSRQKKWLVLWSMGLINLFFTQSKGAWVAFGAVYGLWGAVYVNVFSAWKKPYKRWLNAAAACVALEAVLLAGVYAFKRPDSASFRVHTWVASWAMVQDSPVLGTGIGSFKTIYPAYRKPQIFFIENAHNTETQHAENEFLEQWATLGAIGLILFLWLLTFVFTAAWKRLKNPAVPAQERWLLWGYSGALLAMAVHSTVDVSLRFASGGVFFALFLGLVAALARGKEDDSAELAPAHGWAQWAVYALTVGGALYACYAFYKVMQLMSAPRLGDVIFTGVAWAFFAATVGLGVFLVCAAARRFTRAAALAVLALVPAVVWGAFQPFLADHYYGVGALFATQAQTNPAYFSPALDYFNRAITHNPFNMAYRQYRATLLAGKLDLSETFNRLKGDKTAPATDYERVLRDLQTVEKHSPNHALLQQAYGEFYFAAALKFSDRARLAANAAEYEHYKARALADMDKAQQYFEKSLLLDPVNYATYAFLSEIAVLQRRPDEARARVAAYRRGPENMTEENWLIKMAEDPRAEQLERRIQAAFGPQTPGKTKK